eukprot:gene11507-13056_t
MAKERGGWVVQSQDLTSKSEVQTIHVPESTDIPGPEINLGLTLEMYGCKAGCACYPGGTKGAAVTFSHNSAIAAGGASIPLRWRQANSGSCRNQFAMRSNGDVTMSWGTSPVPGPPP